MYFMCLKAVIPS